MAIITSTSVSQSNSILNADKKKAQQKQAGAGTEDTTVSKPANPALAAALKAAGANKKGALGTTILPRELGVGTPNLSVNQRDRVKRTGLFEQPPQLISSAAKSAAATSATSPSAVKQQQPLPSNARRLSRLSVSTATPSLSASQKAPVETSPSPKHRRLSSRRNTNSITISPGSKIGLDGGIGVSAGAIAAASRTAALQSQNRVNANLVPQGPPLQSVTASSSKPPISEGHANDQVTSSNQQQTTNQSTTQSQQQGVPTGSSTSAAVQASRSASASSTALGESNTNTTILADKSHERQEDSSSCTATKRAVVAAALKSTSMAEQKQQSAAEEESLPRDETPDEFARTVWKESQAKAAAAADTGNQVSKPITITPMKRPQADVDRETLAQSNEDVKRLNALAAAKAANPKSLQAFNDIDACVEEHKESHARRRKHAHKLKHLYIPSARFTGLSTTDYSTNKRAVGTPTSSTTADPLVYNSPPSQRNYQLTNNYLNTTEGPTTSLTEDNVRSQTPKQPPTSVSTTRNESAESMPSSSNKQASLIDSSLTSSSPYRQSTSMDEQRYSISSTTSEGAYPPTAWRPVKPGAAGKTGAASKFLRRLHIGHHKIKSVHNLPPEQYDAAKDAPKSVILRSTMRKEPRSKSFNEDKPWKHHSDAVALSSKEKERYERLWAANKGTYVQYTYQSDSSMENLNEPPSSPSVEYIPESSLSLAPADGSALNQTNSHDSQSIRSTSFVKLNKSDISLGADNSEKIKQSLESSHDASGNSIASTTEAVHGYVVRIIWRRSRLSDSTLAVIWDLVDRNYDGTLNRESFLVGMWLVDQCLYGRKLPSQIDPRVWSSVGRLNVKVRLHRGKHREEKAKSRNAKSSKRERKYKSKAGHNQEL